MFTNKLIKIYFTRLLGIIASILSYTIVIPKLSSNVGSYGIYTVVVSLLMLLQYADLGFLGAGQKYAAECFGRKDKDEEIKILSFVHFILLVVVIVYAILLFFVYLNPKLIFNNLTSTDFNLAKKLILIFIYFSPVIVMQRFVSAVFGIRLDDYIQQYVEIVSNLIKIASTFYFFHGVTYNIVGYILFIQTLNFISSFIGIIMIKLKYQYDFLLVIKSFNFNKKIFDKTKKMALTSVILTITWILYYELDSIYVSKLYDPKTVALFAIGISMLTFSRSLMNVFFSPFQVKFNHLRGLKDEKSLSSYFLKLIVWSFPISIIPTIGIIVLMKPLIISWIGFDYLESITISRILVFNLFFAFISIPISYLAMAREKFTFLLISSISLPFLYILIIFGFKNQLNYLALPIAKVATIFINVLINIILLKKIIDEPIGKLFLTICSQIIVPLCVMGLLLYLSQGFWNLQTGKNSINFLKIVTTGSFCIIFSIGFFYMINSYTRNYLLNFLSKYKKSY
jgi:O-antigen/teichoic acid export membrane protein